MAGHAWIRQSLALAGRVSGRRRVYLLALATVGLALLLVFHLRLAPSGHPPALGNGTSAPPLWLWHYRPKPGDPFLTTYRDLMGSLPLDARVLVAVASQRDAHVFCRGLGREWATDPRVTYLNVGASVSDWSRDRYLGFVVRGRRRVLVLDSRHARPGARGDFLIPHELAAADPDLEIVESSFRIEGGDVLLTEEVVLIGAETVRGNSGDLGPHAGPLLHYLRRQFGRHPIVVHDGQGRVPHPHLDMYLSVIDGDTLALGDPRLALEAWPEVDGRLTSHLDLGRQGRFARRDLEALVPMYDGLADRLRDAGFELVRLPILHARHAIVPGSLTQDDDDQGPFLTWNNVLVDHREGHREVWMPQYGAGDIEARARRAWETAGFVVHEVDARGPIRKGGGLHCVTNLLPVSLASELGSRFMPSPCASQ